MYLNGTTSQKVEVLLGAAVATNNLPIVAVWHDYDPSAPSATAFDRTSDVVTGTTPVDLVPAPSSGVQRTVLSASVFNADTADAVVTVRVYDGSANRVQAKVTLKPGDTLQYSEGDDFIVTNKQAARREGFVYAAAPARLVRGIHHPTGASGVGRNLSNSGTPQGCAGYFGRADYAFTTVDLAVNVRTGGASMTYAEAVCIVCQTGMDTIDLTAKIIAYTDVIGVINTTGAKTVTIDLTSGGVSLIRPGDHLFLGLVATMSGGTNPALEGFNPASNTRYPQLGVGFRPSTFIGQHRIIPYDSGGGVFPFMHAVFG